MGKMSQYPILALSACLHTAPGWSWLVVAVVWPRYFPDSGLTMEGAGRERRGGRDLYNCRVRTQAAATPPHNLNIINIFHHGPGPRRGEKLLETARCRGGECAGEEECKICTLISVCAPCAMCFSKATLLTCYRKKATKDILWQKIMQPMLFSGQKLG